MSSLGPVRAASSQGMLSTGSPLPGQQPAHRQPFPSAGLPPVPHRSLWSCHIPLKSYFTWARKVATCLWYSCQPSTHWRTRPSARTPCCSGEPRDPAAVRDLCPRVGRGSLPLVPVGSQELMLSFLVSLEGRRRDSQLPIHPPN